MSEAEIDSHLKKLADKTKTNLARIKALYKEPAALESLRSQLVQDKVLDYLLVPSNIEGAGNDPDSEDSREASEESAGEEK